MMEWAGRLWNRLKERKIKKFSLSLLSVAAGTFVLSVSLVLLLYRFDNKFTAPGTQPINGMLWLTEEELTRVPIRYLVRDWEFYPGVLLTPQDLKNGRQDYYSRYISIGQYGGMELDRAEISPRGSGTYRMVLSLPESERAYSLHLPLIYSAYNLYIGDELYLKMGIPEQDNYREQLQDREISFMGNGYVQILIAVTDQSAFYSGMVHPPAFGLPLSVSRIEAGKRLLFGWAELAALVVLLLSLYLLFSSRQIVDLYISLFCLCLMGYLVYPVCRNFFSVANYPWSFLVTLSFYGTYGMGIWVCSAYYNWHDRCTKAMKVIALLLIAAALFSSARIPFLHKVSDLYLISKTAHFLQTGLLLNTVALTLKLIREDGSLGAFFTAVGTELCVFLAADRVLPLYEPVWTGWFSEVGFMIGAVLLLLAEWTDLSRAYRFRLSYNERVRQAEYLLTVEQIHYVRLQEKIEEARRIRHDLRQHLYVAQTMLNQGRTEELARYLEEYLQINRQVLTQPLQFCQLQAVDAILTYYSELFRRESRSFEFTGQFPPLPQSINIDLCTLLGNLLENGLEAVRRQKKEEESFVRIHVCMIQKKLLIQVANSYTFSVKSYKNRFYSSKREELGIGTLSIRMIAERYGGYAHFSGADGVFTAKVFLPLKEAGPETEHP